MKKLLVIIILFFIGLVLFLISNFWGFSKETYLSKKVLELSIPFSVKLDIEFLKNLKPANE